MRTVNVVHVSPCLTSVIAVVKSKLNNVDKILGSIVQEGTKRTNTSLVIGCTKHMLISIL